MKTLVNAVLLIGTAVIVSGCAVVTIADAAVSVAATAVTTTVKIGAAAVDAVIPDGEEKKKEESIKEQ